MMSLQIVPGASLPAPPYPADVRAKGWRFLLDMEQIKQSSTWVKAPPDMRSHLLRLWAESWQQSPCGSLPDDDEEIAALIDMPPNVFQANRAALMRRWVKHSDGRYYHRVITDIVLGMMGSRRRDRERKLLGKKDSDGFQRIPLDSAAGSGSGSGSGSGTVLKPKSKPLVDPRGTRLPDPWELPDDWLAWAVSATGEPEESLLRESLIFRDYWHAKPGKDARKADWLKTWRNWIRRKHP